MGTISAGVTVVLSKGDKIPTEPFKRPTVSALTKTTPHTAPVMVAPQAPKKQDGSIVVRKVSKFMSDLLGSNK
jgi:hypothetical protein